MVCFLGNRDTMGIFELRGKMLNVMKANKLKIAENNELIELKKVLGLVEGTDYSVDGNYSKLRYGGVIFLTDADVDGEHITGLYINYFHCRLIEFLQRAVESWTAKPIAMQTNDTKTI